MVVDVPASRHWPSTCDTGWVLVRVRRAADIPALAAVLAQVCEHDGYPTPWPPDPEEWIARKAGYGAWVAEQDGRVCAHIGLNLVRGADCRPPLRAVAAGHPERLAEVSRLFVAPARRRHGLGRRLLREAVQAAHAHRLWPVLDVVPDSRGAAESLYRACGWQIAGSTDWFPGDGRHLTVHSWTGPHPADTDPEHTSVLSSS